MTIIQANRTSEALDNMSREQLENLLFRVLTENQEIRESFNKTVDEYERGIGCKDVPRHEDDPFPDVYISDEYIDAFTGATAEMSTLDIDTWPSC